MTAGKTNKLVDDRNATDINQTIFAIERLSY